MQFIEVIEILNFFSSRWRQILQSIQIFLPPPLTNNQDLNKTFSMDKGRAPKCIEDILLAHKKTRSTIQNSNGIQIVALVRKELNLERCQN